MLSSLEFLVAAAALAFSTALVGAVFRLYRHPLAALPGPRLAALTGYYELYYDLVDGARFPWKLEELHHEHGPIVRISPDEVHINDPEFATTHLSAGAVKKNRYEPREDDFGTPDSIHSTVDADVHKLRRRPLAPFFSRREVTAREELVQQKVDMACTKLDEIKGTGRTVDLRLLFFCLGNDILSEYAFPQGLNFLGQDELVPAWRGAIVEGLRKFNYFKHFHFLWTILKSIPESFALRASPDLKIRFDWAETNRQLAKTIWTCYDHGSKPPQDASVFHPLLQSDLPASERAFERVWEEANALLGAGTETVSNVLSTIFFHLLSNRNKLAHLRHELTEALAHHTKSTLSYHQLERLPYLTAVITEGLRIAYGITARLIRVAPETSVAYRNQILPPGTVISISPMLQHRNTTIFPQPEVFLPERWLDGSADKSHLLVFSRGPRQCLGINLAYVELYLALATIILQHDMQLFETTIDDVKPVVDGFQPLPRVESKGVRVLVS